MILEIARGDAARVAPVHERCGLVSQHPRERPVENIVDERTLTATADTRDADERFQRNFRDKMLEVVVLGTHHAQNVPEMNSSRQPSVLPSNPTILPTPSSPNCWKTHQR